MVAICGTSGDFRAEALVFDVFKGTSKRYPESFLRVTRIHFHSLEVPSSYAPFFYPKGTRLTL